MKHNWEVCRIGHFCDVKTGKLDANASCENGLYPFFTCAKDALRINSFSYNCECVLIAGNGDLNVKYYNGKFDAYQRTYIITVKPKFEDIISVEYLYNFFRLYISTLREKSVGGIIKFIKLGDITNAVINVPSLKVQKIIVSELNKINDTIEDCRELLRNLDALAQSLFYDFFGDPIANPKCWKTKPIKSIAPSGESFLEPQELDGKFWLLNLEQVESNSGRILEIEYFPIENIGSSTVNFDEGNVLYSKLRPYLNKVVIPYGRGYCTSELIPLRPNQDYVSREYIAYALRLPEFVKFISAKTGGAKMPRVKMQHFWNFQMPVPPLELQEKFAERIERIEAQKKIVESTIAELQTLLDSRMDYWFN